MLFTDLYELRMARVYHAEGMNRDAVFEVFFRQLPDERQYVLACGQSEAVRALQDFRVTPEEAQWLSGLEGFPEGFLKHLEGMRFTGDVDMVPEGTPVFPTEPILRVRAPLIEAQLVETLLLNILHGHSVLASKAARIVDAADGRPVMDFGARKAQGREAAMRLARASWIAGAVGTSNSEAGMALDIPVLGTMAHSFIQACDDERSAFRAFSRHWPGTTLLVDTWDSLRGVDRVIELLRDSAAEAPAATAIRLDSGDLLNLSRQARQKLNDAGLVEVRIVVSSGLDEHAIRRLLLKGAPIDAFGVGTDWATAADAPSIDMVYKLTEYDGQPRIKASANKSTWPGAKQIWRQFSGGIMTGDTITAADESGPNGASPLMAPAIRGGELLPEALPDLVAIRDYALSSIRSLPESTRAIQQSARVYPVHISERLEREKNALISTHRGVTNHE